MTLGQVLQQWGVVKPMKQKWLAAFWDRPVVLNRITKDEAGDLLPTLLASKSPKLFWYCLMRLTLSTSDLAGVPLTVGCKFYTQTKTEDFDQNRWTTDISDLYMQDDSKTVHPSYGGIQKNVADA